MIKISKVNIILVAVAVLAIIIAIFAFSRSMRTSIQPTESYEKNIKALTDSIGELKRDIDRYKEEITKIDQAKENLREELSKIIEENEKTDIFLSNGGWDTNIRFLTEYLSKEDSVGE